MDEILQPGREQKPNLSSDWGASGDPRLPLQAGIAKPATCHTFRHPFATHLLEGAYDIRTVQELTGHKDQRMTTMIHTHVLNPFNPNDIDRRSG